MQDEKLLIGELQGKLETKMKGVQSKMKRMQTRKLQIAKFDSTKPRNQKLVS